MNQGITRKIVALYFLSSGQAKRYSCEDSQITQHAVEAPQQGHGLRTIFISVDNCSAMKYPGIFEAVDAMRLHDPIQSE